MADPKKLRELMKKEKEQREKERRAALAAKGPAQGRPAAPASVAQRAAPPRAAPQAAPPARGAASAARGAPAGTSSASAAPVATPASTHAATSAAPATPVASAVPERAAASQVSQERAVPAEAMPPPKRARSGDMPPPPVPEKRLAESAEPANLQLAEVEATSTDIASAEPMMEEESVEKEKGEGEGEEETDGNELKEQLPSGFFDDPDTDAKVRGLEAPSIKHARELEEGLKKFEREIVIEQEKAEETRHELDEEKYEKVAEEEMQYQGELQTRLEKLRAKKRLHAEATAATASASSAVAAAPEEDDDDASGSDVEFDWRAKGFG